MKLDDLRARRDEILELAAKHGAGNVRVFGSVVRGEAGPESDEEAFLASTLIQDTVIRKLQVMAESTIRLSEALETPLKTAVDAMLESLSADE